ncbi:MAG TPA: class I SAM-dependent methyltransferase [Candidatus Limnocylindrales bacterium]|jgi:23S rRNA (cytosine1962-C5)-methyltransferase|nr:class I SAM-dependent methyltransferase [Candidatus Limnocylindrales bacterium]
MTLDRPAPGAHELPRLEAEAWRAADARFERDGADGWTVVHEPPQPWEASLGRLTFELSLGPSGSVGLFPEQAPLWPWIAGRVAAVREARGSVEVLSLFAGTGGSTLAAAAAGAPVVHVDALRTSIARARTNAAASGLAAAPIRWIPDDAPRFVAREARRGRRYAGIVLDPPSYGHGPHGEAWRLVQRLPELLTSCAALLDGPARFLLLTAHTAGLGASGLQEMVAAALPGGRVEVDALILEAESGTRLPQGLAARWTPA